MTTAQTCVIVGGGLAAAKAAEGLREQGFDRQVVLIGDEPHPPYERPPLSKGYLAGSTGRQEVFVQPERWYSEHDVELRLGRAVTSLDPAGHVVELADGTSMRYDKLLLATGSTPRRLDIPGSDARGVHYLRRIEDSENLKAVIGAGSALAIVGAGWIGLEVAAAARQAGLEVTVVDAAEQPLLRVLGPEVARVFADLHRDQGVDLRLASGISEILTADGHVRGIRLSDGSEVQAAAVVVGIGISPNVQLADQAKLRTDNGVLVDQHLRTSNPDIFAAGDVANAWHPFYGRHIRVEHWANALNQPAVAAAGMLGRDAGYDELPYFYTDQYDLGMEYTGYVEPDGYDEVVFRGDVPAREFLAFWLADGRVLAGMNVNIWDVTEPIKALIRCRRPIDTSLLADPDCSLDALAS